MDGYGFLFFYGAFGSVLRQRDCSNLDRKGELEEKWLKEKKKNKTR
jgi:hypothetical protein